MKVSDLIQRYLTVTEIKPAIVAGDHEKDRANLSVLTQGLKDQSNRLILKVLLFIIVGSFLIIAFLIWLYRNNITVVTALIGAEGAGLFFLVIRMQEIYKEKLFADMLLEMLPNLKTSTEKIAFLKAVKDLLSKKK